jgi:hypothetical protein
LEARGFGQWERALASRPALWLRVDRVACSPLPDHVTGGVLVSSNACPTVRHRRLRRAAVTATTLGVLTSVGTLAGAPAQAAPPTPDFGPAIDAYARYEPQTTCDPSAKPGVLDVRAVLNRAYGPHTAYIERACGAGTSEHYEGRALDYMLDVNNAADRAVAEDLISWLLATDRHGNRHAIARRLGVMYIIWNAQTWGAYRPADGWRPRPCNGTPSDCHTNHVHISFSRAGASRQTTWWTARP